MKATTEKAFGAKLQSVFSNPCEKWQTKKLGGIISLEYGKPLLDSQRDSSGLYPVYGANGIKDRTNEFYWDKPSIIVGRKGSAGEINITESKFWPLDVTYFIKFDEELYDLRFLYYLLKTLNLPQLAKGVKPGINRNEVYSVEVCVPESITEQHRIVSILDEAFTEIDKAKKNTEESIKKNKELFEAKLQSVFSNPCGNWQTKKLGEVCLIKPSKQEAYLNLNGDDMVSFVPMEDLGILDKNFTAHKERVLSEVIGSYTYFAEGDLLLAKITPCFENGKIGIARNLKNGVGFGSSEYIVFRPSEKLITDFLFYFLISDDFRTNGAKVMTGAVGHKRVPKEFIENYSISLPTIADQHDIITELDSISTEIKKLEKLYRSKLTHLEELKKSILKQAFEGKL